ncbi:AraC family transcriptional regulator [Microvirga brassicacearum]|uniref:AraC family transcriptional regulator n=1 Tax=Microvirga brassicacearum TaxID=2580413 RepID=UPI0013913FD6|nr:AraC family transcriptional regulator [Microvirga brassicacearum]
MRLPARLALIRGPDQADLRYLATDLPSHGASRQAVPKGVIRIGVACEVGPLLRAFGADPGEVIRQAGLNPELFEDENNIIPYAALGRVLTACVEHTHCLHFGLLVGQRGTLSSLGPIGGLLQHSPTVGEALSALVRHLHLHDRGAAPTLSVYGDVVSLGYAIYEQGVESPEQISDEVIAVATSIMRTLCGPDWAPDEVLLPRHPPADLGAYRRFFRAPVRFDQETAALVFPTRWLDHRIADANPIFRQVFEAHVRELEAAGPGAWKENLRRVLRTEILTNRCSAAMIADRFAIHRRTLSRRLRAEGARFQSLVDETRFEIARQLLSQTRIPLSEVAVALGYSEASAFTRAFRRWSGQSPAAWRVENGSAQPRPPSSRIAGPHRAAGHHGTGRGWL